MNKTYHEDPDELTPLKTAREILYDSLLMTFFIYDKDEESDDDYVFRSADFNNMVDHLASEIIKRIHP